MTSTEICDDFLVTEVGFKVDPHLAERAARALLTPATARTPQQQEDLDKWDKLTRRINSGSDSSGQQ